MDNMRSACHGSSRDGSVDLPYSPPRQESSLIKKKKQLSFRLIQAAHDSDHGSAGAFAACRGAPLDGRQPTHRALRLVSGLTAPCQYGLDPVGVFTVRV